MNLLHPVSRVQIQLPNQTAFPEEENRTANAFLVLTRAVLSARPSEASDYVVMAVFGGGRYLGFWRPGDKSWTKIQSPLVDYSERLRVWVSGLFLLGAFCVDATNFPGVIRPDCIYFTDDCTAAYRTTVQGGGKDMGVYSLQHNKIDRFDDIQSCFSFIGPPVWVSPSF
ncbi:hypothetical protein ACH5RR_041522 [Cinchona calisaya]|uniref:KIB1-4 beta-propeller domain-containing protein n=1 Tax=Cinchona calisaya TaxID=153742 RepID=A0ABD2XZ76_9GENT